VVYQLPVRVDQRQREGRRPELRPAPERYRISVMLQPVLGRVCREFHIDSPRAMKFSLVELFPDSRSINICSKMKSEVSATARVTHVPCHTATSVPTFSFSLSSSIASTRLFTDISSCQYTYYYVSIENRLTSSRTHRLFILVIWGSMALSRVTWIPRCLKVDGKAVQRREAIKMAKTSAPRWSSVTSSR
jgi:hypothetical protein